MKRLAMVAAVLAGCTTVKVTQRDGCWYKETSRFAAGSSEELGFCGKPAQEVAAQDDAASRLLHECLAEADYRWQNRALSAWSHGQPIPAPDSDASAINACVGEVSALLGPAAENAQLKARVAELSQEREALQQAAAQDRDFFRQSSDKMVSALGEAAKRPPPSAVATATSSGTARTDSTQEPQPPTTVVGFNGAAPVPLAPVSATRAASCPRQKSLAGKPEAKAACAGAEAPRSASLAPKVD